MTVSSTTSRADYNGNGATTAFTIPFYVLDTTHVQVIRTQISTGLSTTLALTTDYTVTLGGASSTLVMLAAPTADQRLSILRNVPTTQTTHYVENDPFPASSHEQALDKLTMEVQQLAEAQSRALTLSPAASGTNATLPTPVGAAIIGWTAAGDALTNYDQRSLVTSVVYGTAQGDVFTGDGVQSAFTLSNSPGALYNLDVSIGGVTQTPGVDFLWTSGTTLTTTSPVPAGVSMYVRYMQALPQAGQVIPDITGKAGKYLHNNGLTLDWADVASSATVKRIKADFGAVGDGVADDTAVLRSAIASLPEGAQLAFDGLVRITDTVAWNRRVLPVCLGTNTGIVVDVGTSKNGVEFLGTDIGVLWGLNGMDIDLNVYGKANCCVTAVVAARIDRSNVNLRIRAGATAYGLRVRGCLITDWKIESSGNYTPPGLPFTPGLQNNHMAVENYGVPLSGYTTVAVSGPATPGVVTWTAHGLTADTGVVFGGTGTPPAPFIPGKPYFVQSPTTNTFTLSDVRGGTAIATTGTASSAQLATCAPIASNTNDFDVNLEGGAQGYVQVPMPGEGCNTLHGEIEGLTGAPFYIEDSLGMHITDLRMEQNLVNSTIKGSLQLKIGDSVTYLAGQSGVNTINMLTCRSYGIDGYYGKLNIDSTSQGGTLGPMMAPDQYSITNGDPTLVQTAASVISLTTDTMAGGPGHPTMETLFVNPFLDIYDTASTTVGPPLNVSMNSYTSGDVVLETSVVYPRSPSVTAARCISRGTAIQNGVIFTPGVQPWTGTEWVSVFVPLRVLSASFTAVVHVYDGVKFKEIGRTKSGGVWEEIRGSCSLTVGNNWSVCVSIMNAAMSAYVAGVQYYVGGLNVVKGALPPATIENSHARMNYVTTSISQTPWRRGATAVVGGIAYYAVGNASAADWKQIS